MPPADAIASSHWNVEERPRRIKLIVASKARRGIKSERIEERKKERRIRSDDDDDLNSFLFVRNDRRREGEIEFS